MSAAGTAPAGAIDSHLQRIADAMETISQNTNTMCVKLFGATDPDKENATGRLPAVEKMAERAHTKLIALEKRFMLYQGIGAAILWAANHYFK